MTNAHQDLIKQAQSASLEQILLDALNYHFVNFLKLEDLAEPYSDKDRAGTVDTATRMRANTNIKFEILAYIIHLRRLKPFIASFGRQIGLTEPRDPELLTVWRDLMEKDGVVNMLANKWAAHRSVDDPRGESNSLHLEVLLNLEQTITFWGNGHIFLPLGRHSFYLFHYHPKALKFISWVFDEVKKSNTTT